MRKRISLLLVVAMMFSLLAGLPASAAEAFTPGVSGTFVLAAKVEGSYYAMPNNFEIQSGKIKSVEIFPQDGEVTAEDAASYAFTITTLENGRITISNGGDYLGYADKKLTRETAPYEWDISAGEGDFGSWKISSPDTPARGILFRQGSYFQFSGYAYSNVKVGGEYYNMELLPVAGGASCPHEATEVQNVKEATCLEDGYTGDTVCTACGAVIARGESIPALGHSYTDGVCTRCGAEETVTPDYSGRYYIAGIRSKETNYQYLKGTMNGSRYAIEDSGLSALPERVASPEADKVFVLEKTADGSYRIYCEGIQGEEKYLGWTSGNTGLFVSAADARVLTVERQDSGLYQISFEGDATRYLSLNVTPSNRYAAWYKTGQIKDLALLPVETSEAQITCSGRSLLFRDIIQMRYYFDFSLLDGVDPTKDAGLLIWTEDEYQATDTHDYATAPFKAEGLTEHNTNGYYGTSAGIPAKNMGDLQYVIAYARLSDGSYVYSEPVSFSPRKYADLILSGEHDETMKELVVALMHYGAAAQLHFGYKTDALMDEGLAEMPWDESMLRQPAADTAGKFQLSSDARIEHYGASLTFVGAINHNIYKRIDAALLDGAQKVGMLYWNDADYAAAETLTPENATGDVTAVENNGYYKAAIEGTSAKDLATNFYTCFYVVDRDGVYHYSALFVDSAHGYAARVLKSADTAESMKALAKAMIVYNVKAAAHLLKEN